MAGQVSAILKGLDYQHLISWYHILSLKTIKEVKSIKLENASAGYVDDLAVEKENGFVDFYQIKYHVRVNGQYSMAKLIKASKGISLMQKFWDTWNKLIKEKDVDLTKIRLILYSNWVYHPDDKILRCVSGEDGHLSKSFFDVSARSACGKQKKLWKQAHDATDADFANFAKAISFQLGRNFTKEIKGIISDRMQLCGLQSDENAMMIAVGIVNGWIKAKKENIDISDLENEIERHNLRAAINTERAASVYLVTIKDRKFDLTPDYIIDWRHYFQDAGGMGGHELLNADSWNTNLLPELKALESRINNEVNPKLIRARGLARLSAWFAFGYTFLEVNKYTIEIEQNEPWRTDAEPNLDFAVIATNSDDGEIFSGGNKVVAVGISVTGPLDNDVRRYIETHGGVDALLLLRPAADLGRDCFKTAGDVVAFTNEVKKRIRDFVSKNQAEKLLLFYFGPLSGACFLGHQLNALCKEIQIMENIPGGGYIESFTLR